MHKPSFSSDLLLRVWFVVGTSGGPITNEVSAWPWLACSQCRLVYWWIPVRSGQQLAVWFSSTKWHSPAAASHPRCVSVCINVGTIGALCDPAHLCVPGQALLSCLPLGPLFSVDRTLQVPNTSGTSHSQKHTICRATDEVKYVFPQRKKYQK